VGARHRRRCCWPDTSAAVVPDQNTCAGKKKKEKTWAADCDGDQKQCTMRRCEIASERERERERAGEGENARARGVWNNTRRVFIKYLQMLGAWMLVPGGYLTSTSLGLYIFRVGARGNPLGSFFFFFFPFFGSCWQPFSYVLALFRYIKN
jgi:hypothetical protein